MKKITTPVLVLMIAGCSGDGSSSPKPAPPVSSPSPAPSPTPSPGPAPSPSPAPTPAPSPAPTPAPSPSASNYLRFEDVYITRIGSSGITLQSACSGFVFSGQPPAILPAVAFGRGLTFRYLITPQVWAIGGEVGASFDGRDSDAFARDFVDPSANGILEVAYSKVVGPEPLRFTILRPTAAAAAPDYARLASVWAAFQGSRRLYQCLTGIPTVATELAASPSGAYGRSILLATAYVGEGASARAYTLERSQITISADQAARQVTVSLRLIGTAVGGGAPELDLGTFAASAPVDPASGNFTASLTSSNRAVTGTISGRFFGPQAVEIGAAFGASVAATGTAPAYAFAGTVYGLR